MKGKLAVIVAVVVFALSSMGMSFANNEFMFFTDCDYWDNESVKFIGDVYAYIENNQLNISITGAYPGYKAFVSFTFEHLGNPGGDPAMYLLELNVNNDNESALSVNVTDSEGNLIEPGMVFNPDDVLEGLVTIEVLNEALQDHQYSFSVVFEFSDELLF